MNLYKIEQTHADTYDTYDSAVVAAESEEEARCIHPAKWYTEKPLPQPHSEYEAWACDPEYVTATLIGTAVDSLQKGEVVVASFNAG